METPLARRHERLDAIAVGTVTLLCALWGVQQVVVKFTVVAGIGPLLQAGLRSLLAAALVALYIRLRQGRAAARALVRLDAATAPGLLVATLFGVEFIALYPGVQMTTASRAVIFLYTAPFFTALGAHLFLPGERLRPVHALGLLVAFAGVGIAFADGLAGGGGDIVGDLLCLAAGALWGATTVFVKASPGLMRSPSSKVLFYQLAGSAPLLLGAAWAAGERLDPAGVAWIGWAGLFYQTVIVAFLSYLAWFWLVQAYPAGRLAGFTFLAPLFGILAGALALGEPVGPALLAGLAAIALGLRLLNSKGSAR
jgi:drug/metabolite transporter (DMT)-like permease